MSATINRSPGEIFPDGLALHRAIRQAAAQGYAFAENVIGKGACAALEHEVTGLRLEEGDHITNPINAGTAREVRQLHERVYLPIGHEAVPFATLVTRSLAIRIKALRYRHTELKTWMATEAGYQLYRDTDDWISPHRDRRNDQLLAATITISGSALVRIHEPMNDPDDYNNLRQVDEFRTHAGSMMFLRAAGLGEGEQTIHEVLPPETGSRLILNLRMRPDILKSPRETA